MGRFNLNIKDYLYNNKGQSIVEYLFLVTLIALIVYVTVSLLGTSLSNAYQDIVNSILN